MRTPSLKNLCSWLSACVVAWMASVGASAFSATLPGLGSVSPAQSGAGLTVMLPMPTNSPVALFRALLRAPVADQRQLLSGRTEANQKIILRKLAEYQALAESDRESRLRALEFHHYVTLLLNAPVAAREAWLAQVPVEYRSLCGERLRLWGVLPPQLQDYLRERESTLRWLTRWESSSDRQREGLLAGLPLEQRRRMEENVSQWTAMNPAQRERAWRATRELFEMSSTEQKRVLDGVAENQRDAASRFVQNVRALPSDQRRQYLDGCRKFSQLDSVDRARFLQGWERWKQMSEPEREVWRQVAARIPKLPPPPPLAPKG
ncbi:MAG: DUF3106 domain-containing protein [Verrucomicrobia bacterium]|nr:DUF3106 domain-containing protein [Verrucomicrobiota bacterium]MBI3870742.1 DUF3106 domain-containing protein [Verrucomicrobiota bacterium]